MSLKSSFLYHRRLLRKIFVKFAFGWFAFFLLISLWKFKFSASQSIKLKPDLTFATVISLDNEIKSQITVLSLNSLMKIVTPKNVFVFVDNFDQCPVIKKLIPREFNCLEVPCKRLLFSKPSIDCIFQTLVDFATTDVVSFVNGDIILNRRAKDVVALAVQQYSEFLIVGQRTSIDISGDVHVPQSIENLENEIYSKKMYTDGIFAIDYFIFTKKSWDRIYLPQFLIGSWRWDNFLLGQFMKHNIDSIDATKVIKAVHFKPLRQDKNHSSRIGAPFNRKLYEYHTNCKNIYCIKKITDCSSTADFHLKYGKKTIVIK